MPPRSSAIIRTTLSSSSESATTTAPIREEISRANRTSTVGSLVGDVVVDRHPAVRAGPRRASRATRSAGRTRGPRARRRRPRRSGRGATRTTPRAGPAPAAPPSAASGATSVTTVLGEPPVLVHGPGPAFDASTSSSRCSTPSRASASTTARTSAAATPAAPRLGHDVEVGQPAEVRAGPPGEREADRRPPSSATKREPRVDDLADLRELAPLVVVERARAAAPRRSNASHCSWRSGRSAAVAARTSWRVMLVDVHSPEGLPDARPSLCLERPAAVIPLGRRRH